MSFEQFNIPIVPPIPDVCCLSKGSLPLYLAFLNHSCKNIHNELVLKYLYLEGRLLFVMPHIDIYDALLKIYPFENFERFDLYQNRVAYQLNLDTWGVGQVEFVGWFMSVYPNTPHRDYLKERFNFEGSETNTDGLVLKSIAESVGRSVSPVSFKYHECSDDLNCNYFYTYEIPQSYSLM